MRARHASTRRDQYLAVRLENALLQLTNNGDDDDDDDHDSTTTSTRSAIAHAATIATAVAPPGYERDKEVRIVVEVLDLPK